MLTKSFASKKRWSFLELFKNWVDFTFFYLFFSVFIIKKMTFIARLNKELITKEIKVKKNIKKISASFLELC